MKVTFAILAVALFLTPRLQAVPVAVGDAYQVREDGLLFAGIERGLLFNDTGDGNPLSVIVQTQPASGKLVANADGTFSYVPNPDFTGIDTFSYLARDTGGAQTFTLNQTQSSATLNATLATSFGSRNDNGNVTRLSGTMQVALAPKSQPFGSLHIQDLDFLLVDPISLDFNYFIARIRANSAAGGLRFVMATPGPATTVDAGGNFTQTGNSLRITGTVDVQATGLASGLVPNGPMPIDTVADNITLSGKITQSGATLTLSGPLAFAGVFPIDATTTLTMNVTGNYVATSPVDTSGPIDSNITTATITVLPENDGPRTMADTYEVARNGVLVTASQQTLVAAGSTWRYLDNGVSQGTAWRASGFNDAGWPQGPAQFGYGEGDEATLLSNGGNAQNVTPTYYFRHRFTVADPLNTSALVLRLLRDDGAAVYLNGTEIARDNLAPGATFADYATATVANADETTFFSHTVNPALLVAGENVLAVEVHQVNATSSDVSFDLSLTRSRPPGGVLANDTDPENNALTASTVTTPGSGMLTLAPNGGFTYTPNIGFTGTDSFVYAVSDGDPVGPREVLPRGAHWRYLADGSDQGTAWIAGGFDDSTWPLGRSELGYGDGDEATVIGFGPDPNLKFATSYFRNRFHLRTTPTAGQVTLSLRRDDAAAIYLNGTEVYRDSNLFSNAIFSDYATVGVTDENAYITITPPPGTLQAGLNVIAVEIHQAGGTSSDLSFDLSVNVAGVPLVPLVAARSTWRFLDTGANLGTAAWKSLAFDDAAWGTGPAKLGYGEGDEATVVSFGGDTNNRHITTYFRKRFTLLDASLVQGLQLRLLRDDGAAVYLNGTEILRDGLPVGATATQFASTTVGGIDEFAFQLYSVNPAALVSGENIVAVELHQASASSSDLGFDLALLAAASASTQRATITVINNDTDNDGMDDDYERAFGLTVGIDDAGEDFDGDGQTNLAESAAGTDPFNAADVLRATAITRPGGYRITFSTVSGKSYFLQTSSDFATWNTTLTPFVATGTSGFFDVPVPLDPNTYWRVRTSAN